MSRQLKSEIPPRIEFRIDDETNALAQIAAAHIGEDAQEWVGGLIHDAAIAALEQPGADETPAPLGVGLDN